MKLKHKDIPRFTRSCGYSVDVSWKYLEDYLNSVVAPGELDLDPDFQRVHVWTEDKQIKYIEFCLRGGNSGKDIYFNCSTWHVGEGGKLELVDGKQRVEAIRRFVHNEIPAFGHFLSDMDDSILRFHETSIKVHINDLRTRAEVLKWYLEMNDGGVVHTKEELDKVRKMLEEEKC